MSGFGDFAPPAKNGKKSNLLCFIIFVEAFIHHFLSEFNVFCHFQSSFMTHICLEAMVCWPGHKDCCQKWLVKSASSENSLRQRDILHCGRFFCFVRKK